VYLPKDISVEFGLRQIEDSAQVLTARSKIAEILKPAKAPESNLLRDEKAALRQLKSNKSITILSSTYDSKVKDLLRNESIYHSIPDKPNPLNPIVTATNKFIWQLQKSDKITNLNILLLDVAKELCPDLTVYPKFIKLMYLSDLLFRLLIRLLTIFLNF